MILTVAYPTSEGIRFDHDYYRDTHIPLVKQAWSGSGLTAATVVRGVSAPDGGPAPFSAVTLLTFTSAEAMQACLGGSKAAEVFGDVANFTNGQPVAFVGESVSG